MKIYRVWIIRPNGGGIGPGFECTELSRIWKIARSWTRKGFQVFIEETSNPAVV